jgi:hypothetical protein
VLILDLYFLQVGLQIGFEGLNLEVVAGVALRGPVGVGFVHKTSKFWSRGPYGVPRWSCSCY